MNTDILWRRIVAYIIDSLIVSIPVQIVAVILIKVTGLYVLANLFNLILAAALWYYFFFMETKKNGQTIGKKLLGIKTVTTDGAPMTTKAAAIRSLWKTLLSIESISIFFTKEKKTFHDIQAKTDIVKA
ncbi:putative RDD family membrane protein YckC [Elusimicrobium posterum]|uniref:RDD family protein n=1 Tax=Elusimicrobium posterum TaxID=3116653 RepID=UPI003C72760A